MIKKWVEFEDYPVTFLSSKIGTINTFITRKFWRYWTTEEQNILWTVGPGLHRSMTVSLHWTADYSWCEASMFVWFSGTNWTFVQGWILVTHFTHFDLKSFLAVKQKPWSSVGRKATQIMTTRGGEGENEWGKEEKGRRRSFEGRKGCKYRRQEEKNVRCNDGWEVGRGKRRNQLQANTPSFLSSPSDGGGLRNVLWALNRHRRWSICSAAWKAQLASSFEDAVECHISRVVFLFFSPPQCRWAPNWQSHIRALVLLLTRGCVIGSSDDED